MGNPALHINWRGFRCFTEKAMMFLGILHLVLFSEEVHACSDVLVTPAASEDGSAMIAYNADSGSLMGLLYHYPASEGMGGQARKIYEWDTGRYLGDIPEANITYNVVGNTNEYGLCIGESTFGGVSELSQQTGAVMDYGSLIYITLQRSKTAREAIKTMVKLMDTYGYASEGESFSIADHSGEVWIMEVIGTGDNYSRKGAVWVARKIPDGYITAHANQARITTFPRNEPDNCMYAEDVVEVAVSYGLYPSDASPNEFSFSDVYCPVSFMTARESEARVWSIFSPLADNDGSFQQDYADYATGRNLSNRMPLWIKPFKKVSLKDLMAVMSNHYEGTELGSSSDVGSGFYGVPYRPRPLSWEYKGQPYHNERTVATQQTGWNFIAQMRSWMPRELSALTWFAVDDSSTSPRVPVYGSCTQLSPAYYGRGAQDGVTTPLLTFDLTKAFWVQNMVSNFAYSRWNDIYPIVRSRIDNLQDRLQKEVRAVDKVATEIYAGSGPEAAIDYINKYVVETGDKTHSNWLSFYGELFVRFRDFFEIVPNPGKRDCGCDVRETGISDEWKKRIVDDTGDHYRVIEKDGVASKANGAAQLYLR